MLFQELENRIIGKVRVVLKCVFYVPYLGPQWRAILSVRIFAKEDIPSVYCNVDEKYWHLPKMLWHRSENKQNRRLSKHGTW